MKNLIAFVLFTFLISSNFCFANNLFHKPKNDIDIHSEPSITSPINEESKAGVLLIINGRQGEWLKVIGSGKEGWIKKEWIDIDSDLSELPLVGPTEKQKLDEAKSKERARQAKKQARLAEQRKNAHIEVISWGWKETKGGHYVKAQGEIKNLTSSRLPNLKVLVTWYSSSGQYVTHNYSYVEFNPLMPGQTSPFQIMERYNPKMKRASIKVTLGGKELNIYKGY